MKVIVTRFSAQVKNLIINRFYGYVVILMSAYQIIKNCKHDLIIFSAYCHDYCEHLNI